MTKRSCGECEFWKAGEFDGMVDLDASYGNCRRTAPPPPSPLPEREEPMYWPVTEDRDWCGEFRPRTEQPAGRGFKVGQRVFDPGHCGEVEELYRGGGEDRVLVLWPNRGRLTHVASALRPAAEGEKP